MTEILVGRLKKAAAQLDGADVADPLMTAKLQIALGTSLQHLGHPADALALYEPARATRAKEADLPTKRRSTRAAIARKPTRKQDDTPKHSRSRTRP